MARNGAKFTAREAQMIPFNRPVLMGNEAKYALQAINDGHISGDGVFTKRCHALLEEILGAPKVLLTTSCTHALEMAALLLDIREGDEVLVPSFTFVSTINAFVLRGARPVFVDIRPDTLNIDETKIEALISPRTRAIVPVHYAGIGCEMDAICDIARRHDLVVIEDNAHGLAGRYKGRLLGTFGALATQSFHETKNFSCGEGGALVISDENFVEQAEIIREKGTDRSRFFRGQVDKYSWVGLGSSYLPSDLLAAFLCAQLEARQEIQQRRRAIWQRYFSDLSSWAQEQNVQMPFVPPHCDSSWHMFHLLMPSLRHRQELIAHLKARDIYAVFHYVPLHLSPMAHRLSPQNAPCPVTERVSDCLLRLPFFNDLSENDQDFVIESVLTFRCE